VVDPAIALALLKELGDLTAGLDLADPKQLAVFHQEMGISGLYKPANRIVLITAEPDMRRRTVRVGGDLNPHVLADTRPSTSERQFHQLFFSVMQWPDLHKCRRDATRCNVRQPGRRTISIRFRIRMQ
jgi:hypothetical protein